MWDFPRRILHDKTPTDVDDYADLIRWADDKASALGPHDIASGAWTATTDFATSAFFRYKQAYTSMDTSLAHGTPGVDPTYSNGTEITHGLGWTVLESFTVDLEGSFALVGYNGQVLRSTSADNPGFQIAIRVNGELIDETRSQATDTTNDRFGIQYPGISATFSTMVPIPLTPGATLVELVARTGRGAKTAWTYIDAAWAQVYVGSRHLFLFEILR